MLAIGCQHGHISPRGVADVRKGCRHGHISPRVIAWHCFNRGGELSATLHLPPSFICLPSTRVPREALENDGVPVADVRKGCWLRMPAWPHITARDRPSLPRPEGTGFSGPSHLSGPRFNRTSDMNALGELPSTIEITSTWNGSYLNATDFLSFSSFYRYLHTCRRHLRQGLLVAFLASGGGMYRLQLPQAATKGCFLSSG